jgi:hypothetical protein
MAYGDSERSAGRCQSQETGQACAGVGVGSREVNDLWTDAPGLVSGRSVTGGQESAVPPGGQSRFDSRPGVV